MENMEKEKERLEAKYTQHGWVYVVSVVVNELPLMAIGRHMSAPHNLQSNWKTEGLQKHGMLSLTERVKGRDQMYQNPQFCWSMEAWEIDEEKQQRTAGGEPIVAIYEVLNCSGNQDCAESTTGLKKLRSCCC